MESVEFRGFRVSRCQPGFKQSPSVSVWGWGFKVPFKFRAEDSGPRAKFKGMSSDYALSFGGLRGLSFLKTFGP